MPRWQRCGQIQTSSRSDHGIGYPDGNGYEDALLGDEGSGEDGIHKGKPAILGVHRKGIKPGEFSFPSNI